MRTKRIGNLHAVHSPSATHRSHGWKPYRFEYDPVTKYRESGDQEQRNLSKIPSFSYLHRPHRRVSATSRARARVRATRGCEQLVCLTIGSFPSRAVSRERHTLPRMPLARIGTSRREPPSQPLLPPRRWLWCAAQCLGSAQIAQLRAQALIDRVRLDRAAGHHNVPKPQGHVVARKHVAAVRPKHARGCAAPHHTAPPIRQRPSLVGAKSSDGYPHTTYNMQDDTTPRVGQQTA